MSFYFFIITFIAAFNLSSCSIEDQKSVRHSKASESSAEALAFTNPNFDYSNTIASGDGGSVDAASSYHSITVLPDSHGSLYAPLADQTSLVAFPQGGWFFDHWVSTDANFPDTEKYFQSINVNQTAKTEVYRAVFGLRVNPLGNTLYVSRNDENLGKVIAPGIDCGDRACSRDMGNRDSVDVTAVTTATDACFLKWTGDIPSDQRKKPTATVNMGGDRVAHAMFGTFSNFSIHSEQDYYQQDRPFDPVYEVFWHHSGEKIDGHYERSGALCRHASEPVTIKIDCPFNQEFTKLTYLTENSKTRKVSYDNPFHYDGSKGKLVDVWFACLDPDDNKELDIEIINEGCESVALTTSDQQPNNICRDQCDYDITLPASLLAVPEVMGTFVKWKIEEKGYMYFQQSPQIYEEYSNPLEIVLAANSPSNEWKVTAVCDDIVGPFPDPTPTTTTTMPPPPTPIPTTTLPPLPDPIPAPIPAPVPTTTLSPLPDPIPTPIPAPTTTPTTLLIPGEIPHP